MIPRVNILGVQVSAVNLSQTVNQFSAWISGMKKNYVCLAPAHAIMECVDNREILRIYNGAGLTLPDGMAVAWLLKFHGFRHASRVYGPDLILEVCEASQQTGWRHFFYGGAPHVTEELANRLSTRFPKICIAGSYSPPFRTLTDKENRDILDSINHAKADIVWVGLGSPRQDAWMESYRDQLDAPVLVGVGAAFDFLSGNKKQAPAWIQRIGMEWMFRLATEPQRLWRRYIRYPLFVSFVVLQIFGLKKFEDRD